MTKNVYPFKRYSKNPIIAREDIPYPCNTVFNAAACKFQDRYILVLRVEDLKGHSHLTLAHSEDGYLHRNPGLRLRLIRITNPMNVTASKIRALPKLETFTILSIRPLDHMGPVLESDVPKILSTLNESAWPRKWITRMRFFFRKRSAVATL